MSSHDAPPNEAENGKYQILAPAIVEEIPESSASAPLHEKYEAVRPDQQQQGVKWSPGIIRRLPYIGILALVGCIACIAASVGILVASNGQPIDDWSVSPTVYLALLTTALNILARVAFGEGIKIAWWNAAIRGTSVFSLHDYWASGDSALYSAMPRRSFNIISLAKLAVTLIAIDQPLIQRASSVVSQHPSQAISVTAPIAQEIPFGYTGDQYGSAVELESVSMSFPMLQAFNAYNQKSTITHNFTGCADTCTGVVQAGGFVANCSTSDFLINPDSIIPTTTPDNKTLSAFNVSWDVPFASQSDTPSITSLVFYSHKNTGNCSNATLTMRSCQLRSATLEYPIQIQGNNLTFTETLDNLTEVSIQPSALSCGSMADGGRLSVGWTAAGFGLAAQQLFNSKAYYAFILGPYDGIHLFLPDIISNQFVDLSSASNEGCATWTDPTPYMLSAMNELAFRVSLGAINEEYRNTTKPPPPQNLTMEQTRNVVIFHSDYRYLIATTVLSLIFVLLITPTFYGWWLLGRNVSLNPIEIAKAFDAPLLRGPGSNVPQNKLAQIVGARKLKVGEVEEFEGGQAILKQLKFVAMVDAVEPQPGALYE
ncbi:hypothetical protein ACHAO4_002212 [Trichoderma viride]